MLRAGDHCVPWLEMACCFLPQITSKEGFASWDQVGAAGANLKVL